MATTLTQLQAYKDALLAAIGSGTLTVSFEGRTRTFKSLTDLQQSLSIINGQIANSGATRIRQRRAYLGSKGY